MTAEITFLQEVFHYCARVREVVAALVREVVAALAPEVVAALVQYFCHNIKQCLPTFSYFSPVKGACVP